MKCLILHIVLVVDQANLFSFVCLHQSVWPSQMCGESQDVTYVQAGQDFERKLEQVKTSSGRLTYVLEVGGCVQPGN